MEKEPTQDSSFLSKKEGIIKNKNLILIILVVAISVLVIYKNTKKTPLAPLSEVKNAEQSPTPIATNILPVKIGHIENFKPIILNTDPKDTFFVLSTNEAPVNEIEYRINKISKNVTTEIFIKKRTEIASILGANSKGIFFIEQLPNYTEGELSFFNTETKTTERILSIPKNLIFDAILNPEKTKLVFTEECNIYVPCATETAFHNIKSLDLATGNIELILEYSNHNIVLSPLYWLDSKTLVINKSDFASDGPSYTNNVLLLNTETKKITDFPIDDHAQAVTANPNGTGFSFVTFNYNYGSPGKTFSSGLYLRLIDGTKKILQESTKLSYGQTQWIDDENLLVMALDVKSIDDTCAYEVCTEGKNIIQKLNIKNGTVENLALPIEPDYMVYIDKQNLYYLSQGTKINSVGYFPSQLHSYDLKTGQDKIILSSQSWISQL